MAVDWNTGQWNTIEDLFDYVVDITGQRLRQWLTFSRHCPAPS
jgi:hypothetical protein